MVYFFFIRSSSDSESDKKEGSTTLEKQKDNENYNILFENKKAKNNIEIERRTNETSIVEVKREKWYNRLIYFFKSKLKNVIK